MDLFHTDSNKTPVLEFTNQVLQERDHRELGQFVARDLIQHATSIDSGRLGPASWLASVEAGSYEMLFKLIGLGNYVVTDGKRHTKGKDIAVFNV